MNTATKLKDLREKESEVSSGSFLFMPDHGVAMISASLARSDQRQLEIPSNDN